MNTRQDRLDRLLVGESPSIDALRRLIEALAHSSSTALITGESGTGKELVAKALHQRGPRADGPFVPLNCGAIPRELIESELFGHRKGSFTGAISDRLGRFELAHGGTLFLDEVGDLPQDMQVRLLRVLQERTVLPVGSSREIPIDVRVVAATHRNLEAEVQAGKFREDLFYRLNVLPIRTSPLRERVQDIPLLLTHYAKAHAVLGQSPIEFQPEVLDLLTQYTWPGNVRELSNLVDRFSTLFPGQCLRIDKIPTCMLPPGLVELQAGLLKQHFGIDEIPLSVLHESVPDSSVHVAIPEGAAWPGRARDADLPMDADPFVDLFQGGFTASPGMVYRPPGPSSIVDGDGASASNDEINAVEQAIYLAQGIQTLPPDGMSLKQHLIDIERSLIEQALTRTSGNVSKTAKLLQVQRTTLIEKINKYDLRSSS